MRAYLGEGIYAICDGVQVFLTTEREGRMEVIYFNSSTLKAFFGFVERALGVDIVVTEKEKHNEPQK